jgi:RNA polymerase sigma-70 factor (ECF subfamily)
MMSSRIQVDSALVEAARRGDSRAIELVLDAALPVVLQWCARLGGPSVDAEDACHDVGLILLTRLVELRDPQRFPSWLFGSTRRVLAAHRRRAWLRRWVPGLKDDPADPSADPARAAEAAEVGGLVQRALEELPAAQREALILFDLEERSEAEVAELLDIPIGTARSRVRLARVAFQRAARRHNLVGEVVALPTRSDRHA